MPDRPHASTLLAAYLATRYDVELDGALATIRIGRRPPAAVHAALAAHGATHAAYLTAFNPRSRAHAARDNALRQRALLALLAAEGVALLHGDSHLPGGAWPAERSVLALGLAHERALALAERCEQYAFVGLAAGEPARLVFTSHWIDA